MESVKRLDTSSIETPFHGRVLRSSFMKDLTKSFEGITMMSKGVMKKLNGACLRYHCPDRRERLCHQSPPPD